MTKLSREQIASELTITDKKIFELTNKKPILFRPPFGAYNDNVIQVARELGYYTIQWDIDSLDWKEFGVEPVVDRVIKNVNSGSIVLFHNNAKYIKEYLPIVIERLQSKGFEIVPISELIYKDNFEMDNNGRQIYLK
jgi:peptidoglycan/xylan/chitin deacetylase (PgdA/CDA1 family)